MPAMYEASEYVDGNGLYQAFASGLAAVRRKRDYLNRINVFPVPDGDTGTNIAVTLSYALSTALVSDSAGATIVSIADAALIGARGNSGVIFAQYLGGLAEKLAETSVLAKEHLVPAAENAERRAYEAVTRPEEGTILSAMRAWAEALRRELDASRSLAELLQRAAPTLSDALIKTTAALPALTAAGVVDAGACGFVEFVSGAESFIGGRIAAPVTPAEDMQDLAGTEPLNLHESGSVGFRYCTEALVAADGLDRELLRRSLEPLGDSLIVAGSASRARIHIHTDEPAAATAAIEPAGRVVQQRVDDMRLQYAVAHERKHPIAIVTDSVCDLPRELLDRHQIQVVPLHVLFGESEYLDNLTISATQFFDLTERSAQYPSSSRPATSLFSRLYSYLGTYYESIISIHLSAGLSGTVSASSAAALAAGGRKPISVIDSRQVSCSLGLVVLRAAEAVAAGMSHNEIVAEAQSWVRKAEILVSVRTLEYMVRGGRVKPVAGALGRLLNLKPIVSLDEQGKSTLYGKAFSVRRNAGKIVEMVSRRHESGPLRYYAVAHGDDLEAARALADRLERELGFPPLYIEEISSVVALNAGRGAVAVATMQE